eukprot:11818324-Alexandrium_andersonii.AAC.1
MSGDFWYRTLFRPVLQNTDFLRTTDNAVAGGETLWHRLAIPNQDHNNNTRCVAKVKREAPVCAHARTHTHTRTV